MERKTHNKDIDKNAKEEKELKNPRERFLDAAPIRVRNVLKHLSPSKICDFLKDVCVKVTDFVTQCHVLNASDVANETDREKRVRSRLLLCEATRRVMAMCFALLGIDPLERI